MNFYFLDSAFTDSHCDQYSRVLLNLIFLVCFSLYERGKLELWLIFTSYLELSIPNFFTNTGILDYQ